ncbi:uncharacterized protein BXZ73DRAFT_57358 [Epithele typhae]|uniref:uncharacterized protein n=1 Tax=Epithele typhae TaxID=378194 RepID=UPI0020088276|nr:uncharacterized protein BXZ73DRAFT_57358 [Epithele typhae]KAH9911093.1 hypothetical protein BXZ73DRAFT_57358 [Epithele typhae]
MERRPYWHDASGVAGNTASAAPWAVDYTLQAATLSIAEDIDHEGIGYKYNFVRFLSASGPDLRSPGTHSSAQPIHRRIAVDSFVGRSGHARYEHGRLFRAVFVNLHAWLASPTGARPSVHIDLGFVRGAGVAGDARLVIGHADDTEGLTWAGQSYEDSGDVSPTGRMVDEEVVLSEGLDLRSTEAASLLF